MSETVWQFEYSVETSASPAFAWRYWTDVGNWVDPPARFALEGVFDTGSRGTTFIPGQEPLQWVIEEVQPGRSARIRMQLDRAAFFFEWRFEEASERRTRLTQRVTLTGDNREAYAQGVQVFQANLPGGMKKMAAS